MNKLKIGDIIIITDTAERNALVVGIVVDVYSGKNKKYGVSKATPYKVAFSQAYASCEYSSCDWNTTCHYYDSTLPDKCRVLSSVQ